MLRVFGYDFFAGSEWIDSDQPDAKVDEFEEWKKQQKQSAGKQTTLDEAPPRYHDEVIES